MVFVLFCAVNPDADEGSVVLAGSGTMQSHPSLAKLSNQSITTSRRNEHTSILCHSTQSLSGAWPSVLGRGDGEQTPPARGVPALVQGTEWLSLSPQACHGGAQ